MSENPWRVTFTGGPAGDGEEFDLPVDNLDQVPYLCTGGIGEYLHWRLSKRARVFVYEGSCATIRGPHAFDLQGPEVRCPQCKEVSHLVISPCQAMCTNTEGCANLFFDPTESSSTSIEIHQD